MNNILKTACVQMTSGPKTEENLKQAEEFIRAAAKKGAQFVLTPENTDQIRSPAKEKLKTAPMEKDHPGIPFFASLARELGIWILVGSMAVKTAEEKLLNRSYLFSPEGVQAAHYDKIHLFDIDLPGGETYRESDIMTPGEKAIVAKTPWGGGVGMTICYDLRFAYLFRALAQAGAGMIAVPSAFTVPTGKAHWEVLLRARAIETGSFILAPAQTGEHENGRKTWGHSLVVSPWGEILAQGGTETGVIMAELDLAEAQKARQSIPALKHDRKFSF